MLNLVFLLPASAIGAAVYFTLAPIAATLTEVLAALPV